jgi:hypothetical protein
MRSEYEDMVAEEHNQLNLNGGKQKNMDNKTIKGTVEDVNLNWKSVKINGQNYSGKFTYKGNMPNKGDDVEMEVVSSVSAKDGKTYWNITSIKTVKQSSVLVETRESKSADMILAYAKDLVVAGKSPDLDSAARALIAARKIITGETPEVKPETEELY